MSYSINISNCSGGRYPARCFGIDQSVLTGFLGLCYMDRNGTSADVCLKQEFKTERRDSYVEFDN